MITIKAVSLARDISERATHLEHDLVARDVKKPALTDIHEIRRELNVLEHELLDGTRSVGDAC